MSFLYNTINAFRIDSLVRKKRFKQVLFLSLIQLTVYQFSLSQTVTLIEISGQVTDQEKKTPLSDVSVLIKGTVTGTTTNSNGSFVLRTKTKLPFTLVFSSIGSNSRNWK